jgi:small-conductance mechanosensitive channel
MGLDHSLLPRLVAQVEPDLEQVGESGIAEVSTPEWITAGAVLLVAILAALIVRRVVERLSHRVVPIGIARLAGRMSAFLVFITGLIYSLSSIDVRIGPLLAGLGIVGIAAAFALQEILANLASGLLLQTRRPFKVGDQIRTNDYEGSVIDVNLRAVELRTFDGETVYLPNSMVLQNPISNWTRTPTRRSVLEIGIAYDADLEGAKAVMVEAARGVEDVERYPAPEAYVYEFGESSINLALRFWHGAQISEMWSARDRVAVSVKSALDDAGYTIPFPQRTLSFGPPQGSGAS